MARTAAIWAIASANHRCCPQGSEISSSVAVDALAPTTARTSDSVQGLKMSYWLMRYVRRVRVVSRPLTSLPYRTMIAKAHRRMIWSRAERPLKMIVIHDRFQAGFFIAMVPAELSSEQVEAAFDELGIDGDAVLELGGWKTAECGVTAAHVPFPAVELSFAMPTLRIMSIYKKRKREFAADLRYARVRLEQFRANLPARFGTKLADAIRTEAWFRDCGIHGGPPELSAEAEEVVKIVLKLKWG